MNARSFFVIVVVLNYVECIRYHSKKAIPNHALNVDGRLSNVLQHEVAMLNQDQRKRLRCIQKGEVGRDKVELVVSRYDEDVSWIDMYANITTVYNKGGPFAFKTAGNGRPKLLSVANVGREAHTLLLHIVNNYDRDANPASADDEWPGLSELTVFSQGSAPTRGYRGHRLGGGHMMGNVSLHDFVLHNDGRFVFTSAMRLTDNSHIIRYGYNFGDIDKEEALTQCPLQTLDVPGSYESRFSFCRPVGHRGPGLHQTHGLCKLLGSLCRQEGAADMLVDESQAPLCSPRSFWERWVRLPRPPGDVVFFSQGTVFSFTRDQVRRRSKAYYEQLLRVAAGMEWRSDLQIINAVKQSGQSLFRVEHDQVVGAVETSAAYFLEWFWYYVLTLDHAPCPVSGREFDFFTDNDFAKIY